MSFVFDALLRGIEGGEAGGGARYLTSYPGLGMVIRAGIQAGLSGRSILAAYREAGGTVTDANFWRLRQAIRSAAAPPYGRDYASLLGGHDVTEVPGWRPGLYQVNFRLFKTYDVTGLPGTVVENFSMSQREYDIEDALSAMADIMSRWDDPTDPYGRVIGFEVTSVNRYTG